MVAGRLRVACGERRVEEPMDLPEAHCEEPDSRGVAVYRLDSFYTWNDEYFRLFLEVNELTPYADCKANDLQPAAAT